MPLLKYLHTTIKDGIMDLLHRGNNPTSFYENREDGLLRFYTPWGKYDSPMTAWLENLALSGMGEDESTGSTEWDVYVTRIGRRLVSWDDRGFVGSRRYVTEDAAREMFAEINAAYEAWLDADDGEDG